MVALHYVKIHILHYRGKRWRFLFSDVTNEDEDTNGSIYSSQLGLYSPAYTPKNSSNEAPKEDLQIELKKALEDNKKQQNITKK